MLDRIVSVLATSGWAAELADERWIVRWVSPELLAVLGIENPVDAGVGEHLLATRGRPALDIASPRSTARWARTLYPFMAHDDPVAAERALEALDDKVTPLLGKLPEPRPAPPLWTVEVELVRGTFTGYARVLGLRVRGEHGRVEGNLLLWWPALPASVIAFLARGDRAYYRRMARLVTPGRRAAAILFADLEGSTALSREMTPEEYFARLTELTTATDKVLVAAGAVVGKHAGDGATAFFLAHDFASPADTAQAAAGAAEALGESINVGLHWGEDLLIGQVVTDGRLEISALGLEVNECSRIQECARGGAVLASRAFAERLGGQWAFTPLADWPDASDKARRDAGGLDVTALSPS